MFTPLTRTFSSEDDTAKKISYTFTEDQIKGTRRGTGGLLMMAYTCSVCETKQARTFAKDAYTKGVVLMRCEGCDKLHLIADNLGWFRDESVNIEQIMAEKGETVNTNIRESTIEFTVKPTEE